MSSPEVVSAEALIEVPHTWTECTVTFPGIAKDSERHDLKYFGLVNFAPSYALRVGLPESCVTFVYDRFIFRGNESLNTEEFKKLLTELVQSRGGIIEWKDRRDSSLLHLVT